MPYPSRNQAGFTLLELLISLAILSMITIAVSSTMTTGRRVWERTAVLDVTTEQAIARQRLRDLLEAMPTPNAFKSAAGILAGANSEFRFIVPAVAFGYESADLLEITVQTETSDVGLSLSIREQLAGTSTLTTHIVATGLSGAKFQYYGRFSSGDGKSWHSDWQDAQSIPDLVKIEFSTRSGRPIPPLTIQPARISRQRLISLSSLDPPG